MSGRRAGKRTKRAEKEEKVPQKAADRIAVLEGGTIAACGTDEELLASCPIYQDIYNSQMGEGDEDDGQ